MNLQFHKYHGAGNDFIIIDLTTFLYTLSNEQIVFLCNRHFGIGADGLIIFKKHAIYDFEMVYYNSDGKPATMCGNGGRCIVAFAYHQKYIKELTTFIASDGTHQAEIINNEYVKLKMKDISTVQIFDDGFFIDTGSPHFVTFNYDLNNVNVFEKGKEIRNETRFVPQGTNVNFCRHENDNTLTILTFERGVENETLACGTGAVASSIAYCAHRPNGYYSIDLIAKGGKLNVTFEKNEHRFTNIWLSGPVKFVFKGEINI